MAQKRPASESVDEPVAKKHQTSNSLRQPLTERPTNTITSFYQRTTKTSSSTAPEPETSPTKTVTTTSTTVAVAAALTQAQQLLVLSSTQSQIEAWVNAFQGRTSWPSTLTSNQSLPPRTRSLTNDDLAFPQTLPFGHCMVYIDRKRTRATIQETIKLLEGGTNNDSPRTSLLAGTSGKKVYCYHILAAYRAYNDPTPTFNLDRLRRVAQNKSNKEGTQHLTILHLCGHKWCMNMDHLAIGTKVLNDEQTACHRGLQAAQTPQDLEAVSWAYCRHPTKCWTCVYTGRFADTQSWVSA